MAPIITTSARSGALNLQGIIVPQAAVDPEAFFRLTRRQRIQVKSNVAWQGHGAREVIDLPAVGIVSTLVVTVKGTITVSTAAATPSYRWPYDLVKQFTLSANGQSNLISVSGAKLKVREQMAPGRGDKGVANNIGGSTRYAGSLALNTESWGMSPGNSTSTGTYSFELSYEVPVAFDQQFLTGAIFAQTSSTQLQAQIEWNTVAALVATNPGNVAFSAVTYTVEAEIYPVPYDNGVAIVPDLSTFHFLTQITDTKLAAGGENEYRIMGQGIGKQLMRLYFQTWNNGVNGTPLALTTANYPSVGWRFGGSEMPERFLGGSLLAQENERNYNSPIGQYWGFGSLDWCTANAFRDSIDEGLASELRFFFEIATGTTVSNAAVEYVREELMAAPVAV